MLAGKVLDHVVPGLDVDLEAGPDHGLEVVVLAVVVLYRTHVSCPNTVPLIANQLTL